jgi:hypothetical protein
MATSSRHRDRLQKGAGGTLRLTNPVRQSRASSRKASLAWGRGTITAKRRQREYIVPIRSETEDEGCRIVNGQGGLESGTPSAVRRRRPESSSSKRAWATAAPLTTAESNAGV